LAAQARIALRGARRRRIVGSHGQAVTFLEHALRVSPTRPIERICTSGRSLGNRGLVLRRREACARSGCDARRELGDRENIARAIAAHADTLLTFGIRDEGLLEPLTRAWEEFADLEATPAGSP